MAKAFSVASWNVEHFRSQGTRTRVDDVVDFLKRQRPDVVAIYEVEGAHIWRDLVDRMPGYSFFITEGHNAQEVLLGTSPQITAFVTQKIEFQSRDAFMRPGALMTVRLAGVDYTMLFLHLASQPDARGFGLRTDMVDRAFSFKQKVMKPAAARLGYAEPNFLFLGDLNSMGLDYVYGREPAPRTKLRHLRASEDDEISRLHFEADKVGMRVLTKSRPDTWRSTRLRSNLDHVVAAKHLRFKSFGGAEVDVRGWPELASEDEQRDWIKRYSDHALLYFEVQKA
jgi:endonuclease/exonuclease/phosphatase family metal-dependent hydrolase